MKRRSYKYRIYPNKTQIQLLSRFFGSKRFVWNTCLAWRSNIYKEYFESVTGIDFSRELTELKKLESYRWLKDTPTTVYSQALRDQDAAFRKFFKEGAGYPRFKSRHQLQSIRFQLDQRVIVKNYKAGELLKIPGLGQIKVRWTRVPEGLPKMVTVSKDSAGRYFVSMAVEEAIQSLPAVGKTVGIDLGVNQVMTLSDGAQFVNPRHLLKKKVQLKCLQQRLARQQKGSNRRLKTKFRIAKLHTRIADERHAYIHQITRRMINDNQVIMIEDLNVSGLSRSSKGTLDNPGKKVKQKSGLNRSILDVSFGEITRQLDYKSDWYGRTLIKVDRFFPSSKLCSTPGCDYKAEKLTLKIRTWTCPQCGVVHDRDINAAKNIEIEGLTQLAPVGTKGPQLRDAGGEGVYPMAVSPRSLDQPNSCLEQV